MYPKFVLSIITILLFLLAGCEQVQEPMPVQVQGPPYPSAQQLEADHGAIARPFPKSLQKSESVNQLTSNNSLGDLWRFPAEEKRWIIMAPDTAYYRDVLAGAETYISNATDGETWHADAILPDSSRITWGTMRFYSSYAGQENCFVTPWWTVCGTRSIAILWYTNVQCRPTGKWTMNFYNNGVKFATTSFYLKPQIAPGKVPSGTTYNQGTYSTVHYDSICKGPVVDGKTTSVPCVAPYTTPWTIKAKGCFLTACAMVLTYHGVSVDPPTLNTWLSNYKNAKGKLIGYDKEGNVNGWAVADYARSNITYRGAVTGNLEKIICGFGPQLIRVNSDQHWVTATGRNLARTTYLINDPSGGVVTTLAAKYNNSFGGIRQFVGPKFTYIDRSGIWITFHSPGELLLTDPQGRRLGYDPIRNVSYNEIPNGAYEQTGLADVTDPTVDPTYTKEIQIIEPIEGDYELIVTGTDSGMYKLQIFGMDVNSGGSFSYFSNVIDKGLIHKYDFLFSKAVGSEVKVFGGFDGGGQRPRDVNKFLSYANPSESQTTLPAGTTTFPLHIFYGSTIIPGTFKAELNGVDISTAFNPVQDGDQVVMLNITPGRNVLVLSVNGQLPRRVATDTDRLVFKVQ